MLSKVLHPLTTPRSRDVANSLADSLMQVWARAGRIQRHGHLHWVKVSESRTLRSGRVVPEMADLAHLSLNTKCPEKWISIDLETGDVWVGSPTGWKRATALQQQEALGCLPK